jgi:hypothetical protein
MAFDTPEQAGPTATEARVVVLPQPEDAVKARQLLNRLDAALGSDDRLL